MTTKNNRLAQGALSFLVLIALVAGSVIPSFAQTRRTRRRPRLGTPVRVVTPPSPAYYTVATNQTIRVRMEDTISSGNARIGDRFRTTVVDPVYAGGREVIPAGSTVTGRVTSVKRAERKSKAGTLGVEFVSLQLPSGTARAISGSLTDVTGQNSNYDVEGRVSGRSSTKRNVVFIGGGAATGALIGAIAGGGKGAGIGAIVGGGLGVAGSVFSKGKEAEVKPGTEFGVILNRSISLPAANVR
ncbi:MAG: hypothetical protein QOF02_3734 [Blastocatellia bacterium]|nr:hypothetical protein [Blastocatellia bacterium]